MSRVRRLSYFVAISFLITLSVFLNLTPTAIYIILSHSLSFPISVASRLLYEIPGCPCSRPYELALVKSLNGTGSTCGGFADLRGPNQNVIVFSFYGNTSGDFFRGIEANLKRVPHFYPGWIVRVYHNISTSAQHQSNEVCNLVCRYPYVDFCDVHHLPGLADLGRKLGRIWRFVVLGDDTIERFLVRDLDSVIGQREREAVDEWIASNKTFHAMRDHPMHGTEILAGMWGGWNRYSDIYRPVRERIINATTSSEEKWTDQYLLRTLLWPEIVKRNDMLAHDSFFCKHFPMSKPFPAPRRDQHFVGAPVIFDGTPHMEIKCAPLCCTVANENSLND